MNNEELQKEMELKQQIQQLELMVKQKLTKQALERFGNVKAAHPEKAIQLLAYLGQMIQSGQVDEQIDDDQLKEILIKLTPEKKEFKIKRM
ncbi:DNA-binding protein [Candidatus Woesearchaeota archaeon]|nr:DNA-binding protein [Candidatus Woesearchaeota archaeon]